MDSIILKYGEEQIVVAWGQWLGVDENVEEIKAVKNFYRGYMTYSAERRAFLKKLNTIAPQIVEKINVSEKKGMYYKFIGEVAEKCVKLIALRENERAYNEYKFMVQLFKKEFNL